MTISELVPVIADLIEHSPLPRSPTQEQAIAHLGAIGEYVKRRKLNEWEAAFPGPGDDDSAIMAELLDAVYELGRFNLYAQFNGAETMREYVTVSGKLLAAGMSPPPVGEITGW